MKLCHDRTSALQRSVTGLLMLFAAPLLASAQTTSTTSPAAELEVLDHGFVRFVAPEGWETGPKSIDGLRITYKTGEEGSMTVGVTPQPDGVHDEVKPAMVKFIFKALHDQAAKDGTELLDGTPHAITDPACYLKIHDRGRTREGKVYDRMQAYKAVGLDLMLVSSTAWSESTDAAKQVHDAALKVLVSARLGKGSKPVVYPRSRLKMTPPLEWKEQKTDTANGLTTVYTDPKDAERRIFVRTKILPKDARATPEKQTLFVTQMTTAETQAAPILQAKAKPDSDVADLPMPAAPAAPATPGMPAPAAVTYLKFTACDYTAIGGKKLRTETRYFVANDTLVAVSTFAPPEASASLAPTADDLAKSVQSLETK